MSEVLLEYVVVDDLVRVAAIDGSTGTEAILVGPLSAGRQALGHAAAKKLNYVMSRKAKMASERVAHPPGYWA